MGSGMADGLRALRWRASFAFVAFALVFAYIAFSGRMGHTIQIDYRWALQELDSAEVEIDGVVVGILQRYGERNFVTGFRVEPGEHEIRVLLEECESVPERFVLGGMDGRFKTLMADVDDDFSCRVLLR